LTSDSTYAGPYGRAARAYREAGWLGPLPIGRGPGQKSPPPGSKASGITWTGHGAPFPAAADIEAWLDGPEAAYNIGLRAPAGVIGLDVDHYGKKNGGDVLDELAGRFGPLPPTWVSSARPAPSGIRWYQVPTHLDDREVNWPGEAGKFIEIIQTGHRYGIVWPSTNPEAAGATYRWRKQLAMGGDTDTPGEVFPSIGDLPWLPEPWVRGLMLSYDRTEKADLAAGALAAWSAGLRTDGVPCPVVAKVAARVLGELRTVDGSRHEAARDAAAALARLGGEGHRGARDHLVQLGEAFERAIGQERAASGEWRRLLSGAVKLAAADNPVPRRHCEHDTLAPYTGPPGFDMASFTPPAATTATVAEVVAGTLTLPDEFWQARESLRRIRQAAHSRVRSGDVVFYGTLCRLAAMAPHTLRADTGVGTAASLNLFSAIVGPSGGGKSSGLSVGRELIKQNRDIEEFPIGSGEGIAEAFMGETMEPTGDMAKDGSAKMARVRKMVRHNALFHSDEGSALNKVIERAGSTIGETLRSAWSGETIGQKNGRVETTRTVPARSYAIGLMIGYQPTTVLPLLADAEAGTPQRFLYCWSVDTSIPPRTARVPWPGEMPSPFPPDVPTDLPPPGAVISAPVLPDMQPMTFDVEILEELYDVEFAKNTGSLPADHPLRDPFRSQHPVLKVKVGSLLALLESRRHVTADDWRLAQIVIDTSDRVREYLQALAKDAAGKARAAFEAAEGALEWHREQSRAAVRLSLDETAERRLAVRVAVRVHETGPQTLGALKRGITARDRPLVEAGVELAVAAGWMVVGQDAKMHPGASRPG
jgi:hypothetical protein